MENNKKTQAEYCSLQRQHQNTEYSLKAARIKKYKLQREIALLERAYNRIKTIKKNIEDANKLDRKLIKENFKWKGYNRAIYNTNMESLKSNGYKYSDAVDDILDDINMEITKRKNEINNTNGLIGKLENSFRILGTKIRNFWN